MKQLYSILLISIYILLPFLVVGQLYTVKEYGRKDGLNNTSFLTVKESPEGYLWFGTDGLGVVRYDGENFDYLTKLQGRENKHVSHILIRENEVIYSTLYSGIFRLRGDSLMRLDYLQSSGRNHGILEFEGNLVALQDGAIRIFKDTLLINEEILPSFSSSTTFYNSFEYEGNLVVFSSVGNYHIRDKRIQHLEDWLSIDKAVANQLIGAFNFGGKVVFFDKYLKNEVILRKDSTQKRVVSHFSRKGLNSEDNNFVVCWDFRGETLVLATNNGDIYKFDRTNQNYYKITHNYKSSISRITDVLLDNNDDIWLTSWDSGIHKVSLEPFTLMTNNDVYQDGFITFFAKLKTGESVVSIFNQTTYIGFDSLELGLVANKGKGVTSLTYYKGTPIVSAYNGVYQVVDSRLQTFPPLADLEGKKINLVSYNYGYLWYAVSGKGLYRRDVDTGEEIYYQNAPAYYYNVISHADSTHLYFGTNSGVYKYDRRTKELSPALSPELNKKYGYYVGNSTRDKYGTIWFSLDYGLLGITKKKEIVSITAEEYLPSLLIYTLNADKYGNLLVGSNIGVTVIKVNQQGEPITSINYDKNNGFNGYETHMRVSYEDPDGSIYLGTIEGVTLVKSSYFSKANTPGQPIIRSFRNKSASNLLSKDKVIQILSESNNISIEFKSINKKSNRVLYSYRLKGYEEKWSEWSRNNSAYYDNLKSGDYVFEVRASLNRHDLSETSTVNFKVGVPFYKTKWAILIVIGLFLTISTFILNRTSRYNRSNIIKSRDWDGDMILSKKLLFFGAIIHMLVHIVSARIDSSIVNHDTSAILISIVLVLWVLAQNFIKPKRLKMNIDFGFLFLIGYNLVYLYLSAVHPFYFINILILSIAIPYVFKRTIGVIVYTFAISFLCVAAIFVHPESVYNQYLFVLAVCLNGFLVVTINYLQNKMLERLIFTSSVINNGSSPVIAFDANDEISFISENIEVLLGAKEPLIGKHISYLYQFSPNDGDLERFKTIDRKAQFEDGMIFTSPVMTADGEVRYYQWVLKLFPNQLRVIIGQDVSEEVQLEDNYRQIIKNVDSLIFRTDLDGNFIFINDYGVELYGKSRAELVNSSLFSLVSINEQARIRAFFDDILKGRGQGEYIEFPIENDGVVRWIGLNLSVINKSAAESMVIGFLGIGREVTTGKEDDDTVEYYGD